MQVFVPPARNKSRLRELYPTSQTFGSDGAWSGAWIDYAAQESLRDRFAAIRYESATLLSESFAGWVSMDVLTDEEGSICFA